MTGLQKLSYVANMHPDEGNRLRALHQTRLLDTPDHHRFDRITQLAANVFDIPICTISLVDENRQWFLSKCGLEINETPRDVAFCSHAILEEKYLLIEDASKHPIFSSNPLVTGEPHIRFYMGAVVRDDDGVPLGTLCLIDTKPRTLDEKQIQHFLQIAEIAQYEMLPLHIIEKDRIANHIKAKLDPITNAYLRDEFFKKVELASSDDDIENNYLLLVFNIENYHFLSEHIGRSLGDRLLSKMTEKIRNNILPLGVMFKGRISNSKLAFCVFMPQEMRYSECEKIEFRIKHDLLSLCDGEHNSSKLQVSFKMLTSHVDTLSISNAIDLINHIPLDSWSFNGCQTMIISNERKQDLIKHFELRKDLPEALENHELTLMYQPLISPHDNRLCGEEALLRWEHPKYGFVPPPLILQLAEELQVFIELEEYVCRQALETYSQWQKLGLNTGKLSINVAGKTVQDAAFKRFLKDMMVELKIPGDAIQLEIVESSLFTDFDTIVLAMHELIESGFSFALDDFGTGYSSLSYLRHLPVSTLKIDKSFIDDLTTDARAMSMCTGLLAIAQHLKLNTVAEGVETEFQMKLIKALKCDLIQGYYYSKPVPEEEFVELVEYWNNADTAAGF